MRFLALALALLFAGAAQASPSAALAALFRDHDEAHLNLYPSDALGRGDTRYLDNTRTDVEAEICSRIAAQE